ncbi:MAG TPA: NAD(P)-binding domain-containing protein [Sphingomicrobium sp.]|nr:NAD(P)-binding domain-containing protein [Sphingomicrobium sp.]
MSADLPVAIIGAGPVGLAAAAHLAERDVPFLLLEQGPCVGQSVQYWSHVRLFSPWRLNIDPAAARLLGTTGWQAPDLDHLPTGADLLWDYLVPLADHPSIASRLLLNAQVVAVGRKDMDKAKSADRDRQPFAIRLSDGRRLEARAVIDASGSYFSPNPLGSDGNPVPGEVEHKSRIHYGIPDLHSGHGARYEGQRVLVVGAGHSAINAIVDLVELRRGDPKTRIQWALRRGTLDGLFGAGDADSLPARGALGARARAAIEAGEVDVLAPLRYPPFDQRHAA